MLTELSGIQQSDESVWGTAKVSFTIETRSEEDNELIQRKYTFSHASEWDKWVFHKFEERRTKDTVRMTARNWRRTKSLTWDESEAPTIEVPPEVTEEVEEMLGLDSMVLQSP